MWADPDMTRQMDARSVMDHGSGDHATVSIREVVRLCFEAALMKNYHGTMARRPKMSRTKQYDRKCNW
ncbi:uncharacterized protein N7518_001966 [Penicillium psychrosexuale]|uniref:uncharacterized protein n=1 Tax=Penicillium psychrosexuale TaxID=1002107 RepID=UPI0025457AFB|nr:uncharacterized protein N7518_001966 [Penicillium psychrosexuale]KAJ5799898.1 hypothetical protein N7518_001966 [Penicillium psychrosexuale]